MKYIYLGLDFVVTKATWSVTLYIETSKICKYVLTCYIIPYAEIVIAEIFHNGRPSNQ